jgi:hypothetical protein
MLSSAAPIATPITAPMGNAGSFFRLHADE